MRDKLHINKKTFSAVRVAALHVSYSKDYIARLAREQKIRAVHIGRNWYVDLDALKCYEETQSLEVSVRKRQLQHQRKLEHNLRTALSSKSIESTVGPMRYQVYVIAVVCLIVTGGMTVGSMVTQFDLVAAAPAANPSVTADISGDQVILVPQFQESPTTVAVSPQRQIIKPATDRDWLRIRYE